MSGSCGSDVVSPKKDRRDTVIGKSLITDEPITVGMMEDSLKRQMQAHPNCTIANCDCDSRHGEWKPGCFCLCHLKQVMEKYGEKDQYILKHMDEMAKEGLKRA